MIVSHKHKLIFIKPRKVAGTSFEIALSKFLSEGDIITPLSRNDEEIRSNLGFIGPRNFNFGLVDLFSKDKPAKIFKRELPQKFYNHIAAKRAKGWLPANVWRDYRKISLVRNPWDRAVSIFFWKNTKRDRKPKLKNFTPYFTKNTYLLEINYPNYRIDDREIVDTYLRYEHFEEDMLKLESEIAGISGLWETFKDINAKGETRKKTITTQEIFAKHPEVDALIRRLNAWEIEKFGYSL